MAIFKNGILGDFKGTVGTVIGTRYRGINVMKGLHDPGNTAKKKERAKHNPQVIKLTLVSEFLSHFKKIIAIGFHNRKEKNTAFSMAQKYHLANAICGEMPDFEIDLTKVLVSKGSLDMAWAGRVDLKNVQSLRVSWEIPPTADIKLLAKDEVSIVTYRVSNHRTDLHTTGITRDQLTCDVNIGTLLPGDTMFVWMFLISPDGKKRSDSRYLGALSRPAAKTDVTVQPGTHL